jgi:circadian clock protein KaiC
MELISSGSVHADLILGGGFPAHSISIVMGQPGSGKTVFCEQLAFANLGERPVLYLTTLSEPLSKVLTYLQAFDFADVSAIGSRIHYESIADTVTGEANEMPNCGGLDVFYTSPVELQIDTIVDEMFRRIEQHRARRVVIDSLADLMNASPDLQRFRDYIYAMTQRFAKQRITAIVTMEMQTGPRPMEVSPMVDNIVLLEMVLEDTMRRTIRIIKTRGSGHDARRYPFRITPHGIVVDRRA